MPFWSRKKKPHPETLEALKKVKEELEKGTISIESDTWRIMANKNVLRCIFDDINHERVTAEDASIFKRYNEMARKWREELMSGIQEKVTSRGEFSETILINAPIELVWKSWRDMDIVSQTVMDGSAGRIDDCHFWIKRVTPETGDVWLETFEEIKLIHTEPVKFVLVKVS